MLCQVFLFFVFSLKLPRVCQLCAPCQPKSRRFYTYVIINEIPLLISAFKSLQIITLIVSFPGIMVLHNVSNNAPTKSADFKIRIIIVRVNIFYFFLGGVAFSLSRCMISQQEKVINYCFINARENDDRHLINTLSLSRIMLFTFYELQN